MIKLREVLRETDPLLSQKLDTSWEIAQKEWIPTMKAESESHGGLPHLQNVEGWIDKIADACAPIWRKHSKTPFGFNALETYIVLAAALFHDIGRGRLGKDHGQVSAQIIQRHWAQLGIESQRIADELAQVCSFHCAKDKWPDSDVVVKIHPWGPVHTDAIASLLCLADELDTAYDRVVPQYMRAPGLSGTPTDYVDIGKLENDEYLTKGLWRDFISDVGLDTGSRLIKTVLFHGKLPPDALYYAESIRKCNNALKDLVSIPERFRPEDYFYFYLEQLRDHVDSQVLDYLSAKYQFSDRREDLDQLWKLSLPPGYPGDGQNDLVHILRDAQYWARQPAIPLTPRADLHRLHSELAAAVNVVTRTMQEVHAVLKRKSADNSSPSVAVRTDLLKEVVEQSVWKECVWELQSYYHANEQMLGRDESGKVMEKLGEDPDEPLKMAGEIAKEVRFWKEGLETQLKEKVDCGESFRDLSRKPVTSVDGHNLLIKSFRYMLGVDLRNLHAGTKKMEPRRWSSFSIPEFHTNLLLAFAVYLANVRRLWKTEKELPFHYLGTGRLEGVSDQLAGLLKRFSDLITLSEGTEVAGVCDDDPLTHLRKELNGFLAGYQTSGREHKIGWAEHDYALRWMFMRWLMKDLSKKNEQLDRIKPGLRKLEIPFEGWFIEYEGHLFTKEWVFCLEPSLSVAFMGELVEKLFSLKQGIQQELASLPWETLAAAVREPTMEKVRTATARLASLLRIYRHWDPNKELGQLQFGHLIKSRLRQDKKPTPEIAVETSFSAWELKEEADTKPGELKKFLSQVAVDIGR